MLTYRAVVSEAYTRFAADGSETIVLVFTLEDGKSLPWCGQIPLYEKLFGWKFRESMFLNKEYWVKVRSKTYHNKEYDTIVDLWTVNE